MNDVAGLNEIIFDYIDNPTHVHFWKEFVLHALAELNVLNKEMWDGHLNFNDLLANMLDDLDD